SWQRGLNENTNGLLRQYFPKGESLDAVTAEDVAFAVGRLNTRPRKCLDWRTPQHAMLATIKSQGVALRT
ncbi:MAG: IS30 family transposase, partial [Moraxellaceae bacterium]|nr:IS30 family transposase [Moraxellaceae bacterium]MBP7230015.1 IS30 family transposase [Moraxellaceae bacterium]MBP9731643.1 IS30 family transposase [Moraxellaceae bacterium]